VSNKLVVIFGPSGSGKTTLSGEICNHFNDVCVISQDDYYLGVSDSDLEFKNFDKPEALDFLLLESHLVKLLSGESIMTPNYCFSSHKRLPAESLVKSNKLIIVEGTMLLHSKLIEDAASWIIYCDIDIDICLLRRLKRDLNERGRNIEDVESQYLSDVRPGYIKYIYPYKSKANFFYNENNLVKLLDKIEPL
jgi:uridine kinase